MKVATALILSFTTIALVGCSDSNKSSNAGTLRKQTFSDSSVTAFTQTSGVAINKPSMMDYLMNRAYAIDGNISCINGNAVSFDLTALGNNVQIETTCGDGVELSIRQGLLESMAGKRLLMYWGGGHDTRGDNRSITFNPTTSFWGTYDKLEAGSKTGCKDKLTFDQATGTVTIENDSVNSDPLPSHNNQDCLDSEKPGATAEDYKKVLNFRFKNGKLEMHSNKNFPQDDDINQFCIDEDANNQCD